VKISTSPIGLPADEPLLNLFDHLICLMSFVCLLSTHLKWASLNATQSKISQVIWRLIAESHVVRISARLGVPFQQLGESNRSSAEIERHLAKGLHPVFINSNQTRLV
jgi:hypothetical protein